MSAPRRVTIVTYEKRTLNELWLLPAKMFVTFEVVLLIHVTITSYQISDV